MTPYSSGWGPPNLVKWKEKVSMSKTNKTNQVSKEKKFSKNTGLNKLVERDLHQSALKLLLGALVILTRLEGVEFSETNSSSQNTEISRYPSLTITVQNDTQDTHGKMHSNDHKKAHKMDIRKNTKMDIKST